MAKVHPNVVPVAAAAGPAGGERRGEEEEEAAALTVWRKSLLFNCKGFTVFDAKGNLAYRVDSYDTESGDEVVLMDAAGAPAFTVRRKRQLSLQGEQWLVFAGEADGRRPPVYAVRRTGRGGGKSLARVTPCAARPRPARRRRTRWRVVRAAVLRGVRRREAGGGGGPAQGGGRH